MYTIAYSSNGQWHVANYSNHFVVFKYSYKFKLENNSNVCSLMKDELMNCSVIAAICSGASQIFVSSGLYSVPPNVTRVTAVAIGGGGGGANGHMPGGGGGYVNCGTFSVTSGATIPIAVGVGGRGAAQNLFNAIVNNTNGNVSSFGTMLLASGGTTFKSAWNYPAPGQGCAGGSGSGCCCWGACGSGTYGGSGGSGGLNGSSAAPCATGGLGQGNATYAACLQMATLHNLTARAGGIGGLTKNSGGYAAPSGGGGGILVDGIGPTAGNGAILNELTVIINWNESKDLKLNHRKLILLYDQYSKKFYCRKIQ